MEFNNRITRMLGVEVPIVQAPMGWIARSQLAAAVSNSGRWASLKPRLANWTPYEKKF